jgi:Holliday junction resolvase
MTPETAIKNQIKDYLNFAGWFVFPILQGMGSFRGISDLIAIKDGIIIFIECKTEKGKQSQYQLKFESNITINGGNYIVARSWEDVSKFIKEKL